MAVDSFAGKLSVATVAPAWAASLSASEHVDVVFSDAGIGAAGSEVHWLLNVLGQLERPHHDPGAIASPRPR